MTVIARDRQRVILPRSGPDQFWQQIRAHYAGDDPLRWKSLVMFALRVECDWPLEVIGHAFGHTKGHVHRCLRAVQDELRNHFQPPEDWFDPPESEDELDASSPTVSACDSKGSAVMDLRRVRIADLKPAPYNPRVALQPGMPGYHRLERSLAEFDLVQPIVWNERTGHVVAGHQRLEILKHHGREEVDVSVVSLPLEREKALNVALNNAQVGGDWEMDKLVDLVAELDELPEFDATLTGFDEADLRALQMIPVADLPPDPAAQEADPDHVRVTLEVPAEQWDEVRPAIDQLLAEHPVKVHVSGVD